MNPEDTLYCRVPCALDLAGSGTDLPAYATAFGGRVVTAALRLYAYAVLQPRADGQINLRDLNDGSVKGWESPSVAEAETEESPPGWRAALNRLRPERGFDLTVYSEASPESGLGTQAAALVAVMVILFEYESRLYEKTDLGRISASILKNDLKLLGGYYGAYGSAWGSMVDLEFQQEATVDRELLIKDSVRLAFESNSILADMGTGISVPVAYRHLDELYRSESKEVAEAFHRITANTEAVRTVLSVGDLKNLPLLMNRDWELRKTLIPPSEASHAERILQIGRDAGAEGARVCGAGLGGGVLFFCSDPERRLGTLSALQREGCGILPFHTDDVGPRIWSQPQANS